MKITKTKDMIFDFHKPAQDQAVECVNTYKYLGIVMDNKLNLEANQKDVCKKGHQCLFYLRKLSSFHIDSIDFVLSCFY